MFPKNLSFMIFYELSRIMKNHVNKYRKFYEHFMKSFLKIFMFFKFLKKTLRFVGHIKKLQDSFVKRKKAKRFLFINAFRKIFINNSLNNSLKTIFPSLSPTHNAISARVFQQHSTKAVSMSTKHQPCFSTGHQRNVAKELSSSKVLKNTLKVSHAIGLSPIEITSFFATETFSHNCSK